jgi:hypothetical protein
MIAAIIAALTTLKPLLLPLVTFLAGWIFPSPLDKAIKETGKSHDAETKATDSRGQMDDLDKLP